MAAKGGQEEFGKRLWLDSEKIELQRLLEAKLPGEHISTRPGAGGGSVSYLESWKAIELANAIFGFSGWSSSVVDVSGDYVEYDQKADRWKVGVTSIVKVTLKDGTSHEDVGYGSHENKIKATAIENAKKEAVSDARKRALRLFGNALGNSVYDKLHTGHEVKTKKAKELQAQKDAPPGTIVAQIPKGAVTFQALRHQLQKTDAKFSDGDTLATSSEEKAPSVSNVAHNGAGNAPNLQAASVPSSSSVAQPSTVQNTLHQTANPAAVQPMTQALPQSSSAATISSAPLPSPFASSPATSSTIAQNTTKSPTSSPFASAATRSQAATSGSPISSHLAMSSSSNPPAANITYPFVYSSTNSNSVPVTANSTAPNAVFTSNASSATAMAVDTVPSNLQQTTIPVQQQSPHTAALERPASPGLTSSPSSASSSTTSTPNPHANKKQLHTPGVQDVEHAETDDDIFAMETMLLTERRVAMAAIHKSVPSSSLPNNASPATTQTTQLPSSNFSAPAVVLDAHKAAQIAALTDGLDFDDY